MVGLVLAASIWLSPTSTSAAECAPASTAEGLNTFFQGDDASGLAGADYAHAIDLPDGRTLWYFQDAFFGAGSTLDGNAFAHNAALVQDGDCFELLDPPGGEGDSWIGSWVETNLQNWLWPLDAEVGADGHLWLFLAEVQNPNGSGAARGALPVGTWTARYTLPDLRLVDMTPAPDPSRSLFGYSIVSDTEFSYLYGHCYRQFDTTGLIGFNDDCSPYAYVARVPVGEFDQELEYWTSSGWSDDRADRLPVLSSDVSMPVSVQRFGDVYVTASDEGDWFGEDVVVYTAPAPQGPWTEALRYTPDTTCGEGCNNYGAFVMPELEGDQVVIAQSNNAKDMRDAFDVAALYRVGVRAVDVPAVSAANVDRVPDMNLARAEPEPTRTPDPQSVLERERNAPPTAETAVLPTRKAPDLAVPAVLPTRKAPDLAVASAAVVEAEPPVALTAVLEPGLDSVAWHLAGIATLVLLVSGTGLWAPLASLTLIRSIQRSRRRRLAVLGRVRTAPAG